MITIGEFAGLGRVSVRMLRHYDAIGLLQPAQVDEHSGYRYYDVGQLRRLNRIVVLKDLGLRLEQVHRIVDEQIDGGELRAMLRLRAAELESQIAQSGHRLARVQARLRLIESEEVMSTITSVSTRSVPAVTTFGLAEVVASATQTDIGPVITRMYPKIIDALRGADVHPIGPSVAYYRPVPDVSEDALRVHATFPLPVDALPGLERVDVPAAEVATFVHQGSMDGIDAVYQTLRRWVRDNGWAATGCAREVYLETPEDQDEWVTEVQLEIAPG